MLSLDVGEKRIGVAVADSDVRIAIPLKTIVVDGTEITNIKTLLLQEKVDILVIGYPRNQQGDVTAQTNYVELFSEQLQPFAQKIVFQDESLTSVLAEQRLKEQAMPYTKADIDAYAAAIILQDYLEANYG